MEFGPAAPSAALPGMRRFVKWETPLMASTASAALLVVGLLQQQQDQQVQQPRRPNGPQPSPDAVAADTGVARHTSGRTPPLASAARVAPGSIHLDGQLDEAIWTRAEPIADFTQTVPHEGQPATERTEVRIVYDDDAIYVGARMFDADPTGIRTQLARRDADTEADQFRVAFDSYHDHVSSFVFGVNPSGVKTDQLIGQDGYSWDDGWDPVWATAARADSLGWTAELRIPFSQLRFSKAERQIWGVQLYRKIQRKAEEVRFAWSPPSDRGFASFFGHLHGLEGLPQPRRLELLPYVTAREARIDPGVKGNPFNDGSRELVAAGLDLKYGLSSSLTLDATVNPDFGQVEADPAFVNLSAFEQFFQERRPFFIEGADIFRFGGQQFFYSRRIGRSPQGSANSRGGFVHRPENATILAAGKLSGKMGSWSLGLLEAATAAEYAVVDSAGTRFRDQVEPFTNYLVGRGKRDLRGGSSQLGFMVTAVNRNLDNARLDFLRRGAYALGLDFGHRFGNNTYNLSGSLAASRIEGDTLAIQGAQRSSARYYQRPDADYVDYDPTRTSLSGWAATLGLSKEAGAYQFGIFGNAEAPGFELNDAGFYTSADDLELFAYVNRRWTRPGKVFRFAFLGNNTGVTYNFGRVRTGGWYNFNASGQFLNYWGGHASFNLNFRSLSDGLTRGGPLARSPRSAGVNGGFYSDSRKPINLFVGGHYSWNELGGWGYGTYGSLNFRPTPSITVSVGPEFFSSRSMLQYVSAQDDATATATFGRQYIFAEVLQKTLDFTTRLNLTFTPALTLQLYAQPFAATGDYDGFKELAQPRSLDHVVYGEAPSSTLRCFDGNDVEIACGGAQAPAYYLGDPDGAGPRASARVNNPDFGSRSLRGNAVLRWEYRPGSTLFLVWTRSCSASGGPQFGGLSDLGRLCEGPSDNVFAVKANYWLSF